MKVGAQRFLLSVLVAAALLAAHGSALAVIGGTASKHNMTEVPGYGFGGDVCAACHKPHASSGKIIWQGDKETSADKQRDLAPAKAASQDQAAGPGDYPGIYLCLDCHGGTSAEPSWSQKAGHVAAKANTHSTKEMQFGGYSTKYARFVVQCGDCHDVHQHWDGSRSAGENLYMIRPKITTPSGATVDIVFTSMTGPGSMGPNPVSRVYQAVCEACHTQTSFHKDVNSAAHNDGKDCTKCHKHSGGFAGASCDACHGNPPTSYNTLVGRPANPGSTPTGAQTAGTHAFHTLSTAGGAGYGCPTCHSRGMGDGADADKKIDVRFKALGVYTTGHFDGFTPISGYTFSAGNTTGGTLACSSTYCHGNFDGGIKSNSPVWNNRATGDCGTCHAVAPPGLANHTVHLSSVWGPKASCDDCHPANSSNGRHAGHVNGQVDFKDGGDLATTTVCNTCHGCTALTKPAWGNEMLRGTIAWCESCHNGSSTVNTQAGTGGVSVTAPNVVGDGITYGYDVNGHGKVSAGIVCADCHDYTTGHIDGSSPTYRSSLSNFKAGYRLLYADEVPLLHNYSSSRIGLCYLCHIESRVVGTPAGGRNSAFHVHSTAISSDKWYTNFRNMSTLLGKNAGNYDSSGTYYDVPTNIHWNHLDDYGSTKRGGVSRKIFDSDGDAVGDSYVTCATCHNPHGTKQPAMVLDAFSLQAYSALTNQSIDPSYMWLGSDAYSTTRCTEVCHLSGNLSGTTGTKWYREPSGLSSVFGVPLGLKAAPLP